METSDCWPHTAHKYSLENVITSGLNLFLLLNKYLSTDLMKLIPKAPAAKTKIQEKFNVKNQKDAGLSETILLN